MYIYTYTAHISGFGAQDDTHENMHTHTHTHTHAKTHAQILTSYKLGFGAQDERSRFYTCIS